uniref:Nucleoporin NSP1-like C-terminal domain-containing protein n=1 Tax=Panagrolaimus sp. ES5 TaxID=591445 RepID=A0AC34FPE0_9BILA
MSLFGTAASADASKTSGFNFGSTAGTTSAPLFGAPATSVPSFGLGGTTNVSTAAVPSSGLTSVTPLSTAPKLGFGSSTPLFGGVAPTSTAAAPAVSGLTFGTPLTTGSTTPAASFGLGGTSVASTTPAASSQGLTGGTPLSTAPRLNLGLAATSAPTTGGGAVPVSTGLTFGGQSTASTTTTLPSSQTAVQSMSFADFNGILASLTDEFEDLNRQFVEDVGFLNDFDKVLRDNHTKIAAANEELSEIENDTSRCANESECISAQLKDIANLVSSLEKQLNINDLDDAIASKNSDVKRQHIMQMYLATDAQMIQLEDDVEGLSQQVEAIAKITGPDQTNAPETFDDIRQILGNQMDQLIYVDKQSEELNKRLNDIKVKL